jgi:hypothetical protein
LSVDICACRVYRKRVDIAATEIDMFLDNLSLVLEWPKELKSVKQKLGILQRLMMKLQGCWLSMGLWNCWVIDFVYYTTDIVSENKFNLFLLSLRSGF